MSENKYPPNAGQEPEEATEEAVELTDEDVAAAIEAETDAQAQPAGASSDEVTELNDRILRLAAELENTRRRALREKTDAGKYAIANFARDLLGVTDNFERALRAAGDDDAPASAEIVSGLIAGLRMTEKELLSTLERHGVRRIFPAGEKFDPHLHQAVAQVPHDTIPPGHVVDVAQPGFTIGDRVLRAAMVTVSSGKASAGGNAGAHVDTEA
jgi:molecular chaperone GrpE